MRSPNVQEFCQKLWDLRESAATCLPCGATISRMLALAVSDDVLLRPTFDPEEDRRVAWCREVAAARRLRPQARPEARAELEATAAYQLDRQEIEVTGKDLAAGEVISHESRVMSEEESISFSSPMTHQPMTHQFVS